MRKQPRLSLAKRDRPPGTQRLAASSESGLARTRPVEWSVGSRVEMMRRITPVIMCGGAGTRLWPSSRESFPKQFIPFFGPRSSFQDTVLRVSDPSLFGEPVIITGRDYSHLVADQLEGVGRTGTILLEPMRRDSGPAIAAAASFVRKRDPGSHAPRHGGRPRHPGRSGLPRRGPQRRRGGGRGLPDAVRHQAGPRRDGLRLHPAEPDPDRAKLLQGRSLRREARCSKQPRPTSPTAISGTPATSSSIRRSCSRSTASSTPRPSRRRSRPSSGRRPTLAVSSLPPTRSAPAPRCRSISPSWSGPTGSGSFPSPWTGPISAAGPRSGNSRTRIGTAMPGRTPPCSSTRATTWSWPTASFASSASRIWRWCRRETPFSSSTGARATPSRSSWRA